MVRMRQPIGLLFLVLCTVAQVFGQPACAVCRGEIDPATLELKAKCGNPDNNSWGSENCEVTVEGTLTTCTSPPPNCYYWEPPPLPPPDEIQNCNEQTGCGSPIIIDIAGDGYDLTDAAYGVSFDIDGNGVANRISWTVAGSDDAFLWLDGNGNGVVDGGVELFGDAVYDNGFDKLKTFDGNGDAVIDASDAIWPSLRLWVDSNHNGISEAAEISAMASSRFHGVGVTFQIVGKRDRYGNLYRFKGRIYTEDDASGKDRVYDVIFAQAQ